VGTTSDRLSAFSLRQRRFNGSHSSIVNDPGVAEYRANAAVNN
jgi:hypothetical protein